MTKIVKKKVKVRVHGRTEMIPRKVKEQVAASLKMPTEILAQNGAVLDQTTAIGVTSCAKAKPAKKKKVKKDKAKGRKGKNKAKSRKGKKKVRASIQLHNWAGWSEPGDECLC